MIALALSAAMVAAVPLAFAHGHRTALRTITAELRSMMVADDPDRPSGPDPT